MGVKSLTFIFHYFITCQSWEMTLFYFMALFNSLPSFHLSRSHICQIGNEHLPNKNVQGVDCFLLCAVLRGLSEVFFPVTIPKDLRTSVLSLFRFTLYLAIGQTCSLCVQPFETCNTANIGFIIISHRHGTMKRKLHKCVFDGPYSLQFSSAQFVQNKTKFNRTKRPENVL